VKGKKEGDKNPTANVVRSQKVIDHHHIYQAVLEGISKLCKEEGGIKIMYKGNWRLMKQFVLMAIVDAKEHNLTCNCFNSCGNSGVKLHDQRL